MDNELSLEKCRLKLLEEASKIEAEKIRPNPDYQKTLLTALVSELNSLEEDLRLDEDLNKIRVDITELSEEIKERKSQFSQFSIDILDRISGLKENQDILAPGSDSQKMETILVLLSSVC